jgi:peroxiredoxin Q/BCP
MRLGLVLLAAIPGMACAGATTRPDGGGGLLPVGAEAPALSGEDHTGAVRRIADERGHVLVVYFYPKDGTPGCTREACAFRDAWDRFEAAGVRVWGISADSLESHRRFARAHELRFPLLSDPQHVWARSFGVGTTFDMIARVTFLIGPDGRVARVYENVDPAVHADEVLRAAAALASPAAPPPIASARCGEQTLRAFHPGDGRMTFELLAPHVTDVPAAGDTAEDAVACRVAETDDACAERARREVAARHPDWVTERAAVAGESAGVAAVVRVDGERRDLHLASHEEVAAQMRALVAAGHEVLLERSQVVTDPARRTATVERTRRGARRERFERVRARLQWAPLAAPVEATGAILTEAERTGLLVTEVAPQEGGTIVIAVSCPATPVR